MAILQVGFFSKCLLRNVSLSVALPFDVLTAPGDKHTADLPAKTFYLLHGMFGNCRDWVEGTRVLPWAMERNIALIMPSGENHFYVDCEASGERYGEFIGKELPEVCQTMFRLPSSREDTIIGGLSMGGYGALRNGLKYPRTFGRIAALSSALITDTFAGKPADDPASTFVMKQRYMQSVFGDPDTMKGSDNDCKTLALRCKEAGIIPDIYLACGTEDPLLAPNRDFYRFLKENEIPCTYEESPGAHTWEYWDATILKVLDWIV